MLAPLLVLALLLGGAAPADAEPTEEAVPEHAYTAEGPEVSGGSSLAQAPLVVPGIHRDSFARGAQDEADDSGTTKYYRVAAASGQRVHAAATISAPPYADGVPEEWTPLGVDVSVVTAAGDSCEESTTDDVGAAMTGEGPVTSVAVSGTTGWEGCAGEELFLRVTRTGTRSADLPLPVEIQVAIEPAGIGGGSPAVDEEIEDEGASPVPPAQEEPFVGGRSFATAPEVEPGSSVIELVPGEVSTMRIEVQEGQRLRWRTEVTEQPEDAGSLSLNVADATRGQVTVGGGDWTMSSTSPVNGGGMRAPVDLGNRGSDTASIASAWLPGDQTVTLQRLQLPAGAEPAAAEPVTVVLTLEVEGEVAEDAAEGTVLELGETTVSSGPLDGSLGRIALVVGAGMLTLLALVTGVAGVLVLRLRRA